MANYFYDMSVEQMARLVEQLEKSTDDIFNKEIQCKNDNRYQNDETGIFVELNQDPNELSQSLKSGLSDDLMERIIIKIMDNIVSDRNKDEDKKNGQ